MVISTATTPCSNRRIRRCNRRLGGPSFSASLLPKATGVRLHLYDQNPDIKWNFTKFLVGRDGKVVERFEPTAKMGGIDAAVV